MRVRIAAKRLVPAAAAVAGLLAIAGWEWRARGRAERLLAANMTAAQGGRFDDVAAALAAEGVDPGARRLRALAALAAGRLVLEPMGTGVRAEVVRVSPLPGFSQRLARDVGELPARLTLVAGQYLVRLRADGAALEVLATISPDAETRLVPTLAPDSAGSLVAVSNFAIGRHEVTNAEFQRFVAAGGYRDPALWGEGGPPARFVDRTGVPGPADWSNGAPPPGQERQPVTGVSWHEANAYARWAGLRLPTMAEWYQAALGTNGALFPWGSDGATAEQRANFGGVALADVGSHPLGVSPYGAHDMAGNAREWLGDAGAAAGTRLAVGGSWQEPSYGFEQNYAESLGAESRRNGLGFRLAGDLNGGR